MAEYKRSEEHTAVSQNHEDISIDKKYGGLVPKKKPLISKDHRRAFFDSADWALGKQGGGENLLSTGPVEMLRPKLQRTPHQQLPSRRPAWIAYEYPHLGAAGVVANEFVPQAQDEGETDHQSGGTNPSYIVTEALECLNDKYIYSSCDDAYRLNQEGELHVPREYTEEYCNGPCLIETKHVLECIDGIFHHFEFYNRATLEDVRKTIESGCGYGPKRGNFNVLEHVQTDEGGVNKVFHPMLLAFVLVMVGLNLMI